MPAIRPIILPFRPGRFRHRDVATRFARVSAREAAFDWNDTWAFSFREAADALGPVFSAFADYLSSRVDLACLADCRGLSRSAAPPRVWAIERVRRLVSGELGPAAGIVDIESAVLAATPYSQTHAVRLSTGDRLEMEVVTLNPDEAAADLDLLHLARQACASRVAGEVFETVVADFRARFAETWDCRQRFAHGGAAFSGCSEDWGVAVPAIRVELCTRRLWTTQLLPFPDVDPAPHGSQLDVGRAAIAWWLRRAIAGKPIPLSAGPLVDNGRRLLMTGPFTHFSSETAKHLTEYLLAVVADAPDRAWAALAHELAPTRGAASADEVTRSFRCLVPFRDDRSCDTGSDVADHMYLQWRVATARGWVPAAHLIPFYQGCFRLADAVRSATGSGDVVADAVSGLRAEVGARQFEEWSRRLDVMGAMEQQMTLLMQLPQKLDQLLTIAADGAVRVQLVNGDVAGAVRRSRMATAVAAVLIACAVFALAATVWSTPAAWFGVVQSTLFLAVGGLLVWAVGRVL